MEPTENTTNELIVRIESKYSKLSKGQKRLADYVRQNYDKAVFLTAALWHIVFCSLTAD